MQKRLLLVGTHPDDVELGLGGTIVKAKECGHKVFVVDLTSGEPTPYGNEELRCKETERANKILMIDNRVNLGLENRYLFDTEQARILLAEQIRLLKPDILFCPYPDDTHPDHTAARGIVEGARFYAKYTKVDWMGEPHYANQFFYYYFTHMRALPKFSFLIDISDQFNKKMEALESYKSQFVDNPKNRFVLDYIKTLNRHLGFLILTEYAEALYTKEAVKINDLCNIL